MARLPRDVQASIDTQLQKQTGKEMRSIFMKKFEGIKRAMISEFDSHPVTQEIEAGEASSNTSRTLSGYGNLFSFIGFPTGYDPISPIRDRLEGTIIINYSYNKGVFNFIINNPTREELFSMTKFSNFRDDFEGSRSWLDGIETGISGLGYYLYLQGKEINKSRSGTGIQIKGGKKSGKAFGGGGTGGAIENQRSRYTRTSYISGILKRFNANIQGLRALKV
jgi:hypothetical protein